MASGNAPDHPRSHFSIEMLGYTKNHSVSKIALCTNAIALPLSQSDRNPQPKTETIAYNAYECWVSSRQPNLQ